MKTSRKRFRHPVSSGQVTTARRPEHLFSLGVAVALLFGLVGCTISDGPEPFSLQTASVTSTSIFSQARLGNVFFDDEAIEIGVDAPGDALAWNLYDVRDVIVLEGREDSADTSIRLRLPAGERGYYRLSVQVLRSNQVVSTAQTTLAVLSRHGFSNISAEDSIFAAQTHFGQFPEGKPAYDPETDSYTAPGNPKNDPELVRLLEVAGVRQVRDELPWSTVEPERRVYAFPEAYDRYVTELQQHDISLLSILNYGNKVYDQDEEGVGAFPFTDDGRDGYANYGVALLERYPLIEDLEIWNEPNALAPWNRGPCRNDGPPRPDPEHIDCYYRLLKATYQAVKAEDPSVRVSGPAGVTLPYGYLEDLFQRGALDYLDAVTLHPYGYPAAPEFAYGHRTFIGTSLEDRARQLRNLISRYGSSEETAIYFTEIGWPTGDATKTVSEASQAKFLTRAYVLSLAAGVDKVFWYDFVNDGIEDDKREQNYGLIHAKGDPNGDYTPKPGYVAYAVAARQLTGAELTGKDEAPDGVSSYRFRTAEGDVRVVWVPADADVRSASHTITLRTDNEITVTGMMGSVKTYTPVDGEIYLTVSGEPLYIRGEVNEIVAGASISLEPGGSEAPVVLRVDNSGGSDPLQVNFELEGQNPTYPVRALPGQDARKPITLGGETGLRTIYSDVTVRGRLAGSISITVYVVDPATLPFPEDALLADSFPYPGSRGESLQGDPPEIDNTGDSVTYSGFAPAQFAVASTAIANDINDGAAGALRLAPPRNADVTLVLPTPARQFTAEVDLVPFTGDGSASRNIGLFLRDSANANFFGSGVSLRFGIGMEGNGVLRAQQRGGGTFTVPVGELADYDPDNWNTLRLDVDLDAKTVAVVFNGTKTGEYEFVNLDRITHVGLEAISGATPGTGYLDNFSVSPIAVEDNQ